jgi:hypothetical protein
LALIIRVKPRAERQIEAAADTDAFLPRRLGGRPVKLIGGGVDLSEAR